MNHLPRIALGNIRQGTGHELMVWALINVLERIGLQVQSFLSRPQFCNPNTPLSATDTPWRILDSWLMAQEFCRELFVHGSRSADLAVVLGQYNATASLPSRRGRLETLCQWLDLPQLAIIDVASLEICVPPVLPKGVDGLLLNNVSSIQQLSRVQVELECQLGLPVLGALLIPTQISAAFLDSTSGTSPTWGQCRVLGEMLAPRLDLDRIIDLSARRGFSPVDAGLFQGERRTEHRSNVAVAYDEAFHVYSADTLEMLELQGANIKVFSPLHSECLPAETDVVYLGCGQPEKYARQLSANVCMKEAIWRHVQMGRRVYGECGGMAYLCREILIPGEPSWPMVGVLPAVARQSCCAVPVCPVDITTRRESWLFSTNERVRGYLNPQWAIHPAGELRPLGALPEHDKDLIGDYRVVGSRVQLNFATQPNALARFFHPLQQPSLTNMA